MNIFNFLLVAVYSMAVMSFIDAVDMMTDDDDDVMADDDDDVMADDDDDMMTNDDDDVETNEEDNYVSEDGRNVDDMKDDNDFDVVRFYDIRTSTRDQRSYRGLILSNDLYVLLISDPETDMAAACMTVHVGYMHDFEEVPGIAHFLEHMLFMGSEEYPDEDHWDKFISEHAGKENGQTGEGSQSYYFDISSDNLSGALDIMAHMFLKPLMSDSATERELNAVDSEMDMHSMENYFPSDQLKRSLSKPGHKHANFNVGNKKTLETDPKLRGINVRAKLKELHSDWYSSNVMYLTVLGKESLNALERMVVPLYERIENKKVAKLVHTEHPWGPEQLNRKVYYVPKTNIRELDVRFPVPSFTRYYKNTPEDYVSHLIGHEGRGSLFAELKRRNWIDSLAAGAQLIPGFAFFEITTELTEEGLNHVDEIVQLIFQYIHLLRTDGVNERVFDELKKIGETNFEFRDIEEPYDCVRESSEALDLGFPFEDVLSSDVPEQWNPSTIEGFLDYLVPENMNIIIGSRSFEKVADLEEKWYGTKHKVERISEDLIYGMWKITQPYDKFFIPPPNEYIAENFDLYPPPPNTDELLHPRLIHESQLSQFWLKQDDEFAIPKFYVKVNIFSPVKCSNIKNNQLAALFTQLFGEEFTTRAGYNAALAGLDSKIETSTCGLQILFSGYTEKLPLFARVFLREIINFEVEEARFENQKEALVRRFKDYDVAQPHSLAVTYLEHLIYGMSYSVAENRVAVETLCMDDMKLFMKRLFSRVFLQGFVYGNCDEKLAKEVINIIESAFAPKSAVLAQEIVIPRILALDDGTNFTYQASHKRCLSSSYLGYYQIGADYPTIDTVVTNLFVEIVRKKCYKTLRSDEQLGYIVQCQTRHDEGVTAFVILVQSGSNPFHVRLRANAFLNDLRQTLIQMNVKEFETYKTSLRDRYLEKVLGQEDRFNELWTEIEHRRYDFGRELVKASLLDSVTKEHIVEFFETYIDEYSRKLKKLNIHVKAGSTNPLLPHNAFVEENPEIDVVAFKSGYSSFAHTFRHIEVGPPGTPIQLYTRPSEPL